MGAKRSMQQRHWQCGVLMLAALMAFGPAAFTKRKPSPRTPANTPGRLSADKSGQFSTSAGLRLHLIADEGDVHISTHESLTVDYRVHLEVRPNDSTAREILDAFSLVARNTPDGVLLLAHTPHHGWGQHLSVTFEVAVPRNYNLDIATQGGNVLVGDIQGRVAIGTNGGNISTGEIAGPARIVTDGG
ncbi:MAG TPA: hypothetical protein VMV59_00095, partial [Candidatus Dormibacteraeota bacterium]|nr:hypothetical protein [Candidatus Dormibacteraeota bacterium]